MRDAVHNKNLSHSTTQPWQLGLNTYVLTGESNPQGRVSKDRLHSQEGLLEGVCDAHQVHVIFLAFPQSVGPRQSLQDYFVQII